MPHVTVFSGRAEVNGADADPVVQAAITSIPKADNANGEAPPPERSDALPRTEAAPAEPMDNEGSAGE